jgi:hypothetical protein
MFNLWRPKPVPLSLRALRLYSVAPIGKPRRLDRAELVEGLLSACEKSFGSTPRRFDIYGPYGISKGRGVGIKAFRNKLAKRGHADYYGLEGGIGEPFGFWCFFMPERNGQAGWDEVVLWFDFRTHGIDVPPLAKTIIRFFPANYGYVKEFPADCLVPSESRPKKTFMGVTFVGDPEYESWRSRIPTVLDGKVRNIYRCNLLNAAQSHSLQSFGFPKAVPFAGDVGVLEFADDEAFKACADRYQAIVPAA